MGERDGYFVGLLIVTFLLAVCGCKSAPEARVASAKTATEVNSSPFRLASLTVTDVEDVSANESDGSLPAPIEHQDDDGMIAASEVVTGNAGPEYFISIAVANHPRISAARSRVTAALHRIPQVRSLPDPQFSNTFWPLHDQAIQTAAGRIGNQMSLAQAVPWPKKLDAKAAVAYREAQVAMAEVTTVELDIVESIRLAYAEYWYAARAIEIVEENIELVGELTRIAVARNKSGGSQQDVLRAELEADKLQDQLLTLEKRKRMAAADLAALIYQPIGQMPEPMRDEISSPQPFSLDECIAIAEVENPQLRGLSAQINQDRANQRLAGLQEYPDLNFGIQWALVNDNVDVISPVANGADNLGFTVGVSLPIRRERIKAGVCEAAAKRQSTAQLREATRAELLGKLRRLIAQSDALAQQQNLYLDRIIPRADQAIRVATTDYTANRTDFASLVDLFQELLAYQTQVARTRASLFGVQTQIKRAIGGE